MGICKLFEMQHWPDWGSAKALEKSFTGMTRRNKLLRHVISFVESHTFSGQKSSS